jgi:hypothetical protein
MANVVAVADVSQLLPLEAAEFFVEREVVGQRLAGVIALAQCVDYRDRGPLGQLVERALRESAGHDGVDPAIEVARHVADGLALANPSVAVILENVAAAELLDGQLKRHSGAQRRLFEEQRDIAARQIMGVRPGPGFDVASERKQVVELDSRNIGVDEKIGRGHLGYGRNRGRDGHRGSWERRAPVRIFMHQTA